jgi:hypothetical protein
MNIRFVWRKILDLKTKKRMLDVDYSIYQFFFKKITRFEVLKNQNQWNLVEVSVLTAFFTFYVACWMKNLFPQSVFFGFMQVFFLSSWYCQYLANLVLERLMGLVSLSFNSNVLISILVIHSVCITNFEFCCFFLNASNRFHINWLDFACIAPCTGLCFGIAC